MIGTTVILYNRIAYNEIGAVFSAKVISTLQLLTPALNMCNLLKNK